MFQCYKQPTMNVKKRTTTGTAVAPGVHFLTLEAGSSLRGNVKNSSGLLCQTSTLKKDGAQEGFQGETACPEKMFVATKKNQ